MVEIYDIETFASCFTYTGIDRDTGEISTFIIHPEKDETENLIRHMLSLSGMVGFNNIAFDYPVLHYLIQNRKKWTTTEQTINELYYKAQELINEQVRSEFAPTPVSERQWLVPQLDLYRLWHYNNPARNTSLKALQISLNFPNVMESPLHHTTQNITLNQVQEILEYNLNDVEATLDFYGKSKEKIQLRKDLLTRYSLKCINFPDVKIGEQLLLNNYSSATDQDKWEVKTWRTQRDRIAFKDCIMEKIQFKTKKFQRLLDKMLSITVTETKGSFSEKIIFDDIKLTYGTGGLHGCTRAGVYSPKEDELLKSADVASLYPSIGITNGFYPEHLGPIFCRVYENMLKERMVAKRNKEMTISDALKLAANGAYGKSSEKNSFLYDPIYTMKITLNGQLLITRLIEDLEEIPNIKFIMVNTDGFEVLIKKDQEELYYSICKKWEEFSKLVLEFADYEKMVIGDVNNYSAKTTDGKYKFKGRFEIDKMVGNERAWHKDNSFRIVPIALREFFYNNIPVEETIANHQDIYDFCGRQKFKSDSYGEIHTMTQMINGNGWFNKIEKQQKNVRYYIANNGSTFIKKYTKGSQEFIHKGYTVTIFNKYFKKDMKDYGINYQFYIDECNKEINNILNPQLDLFNT